MQLTVLINDKGLLELTLDRPDVTRVYIEYDKSLALDMAEAVKAAGKEAFLAMPFIFRKETREAFDKAYDEMDKAFDGFLVRNIDELGYMKAKETDKTLVSDYRLYSFNGVAVDFMKKAGINETCAPIELNKGELMKNAGLYNEAVIYGHIPLMVSAQCVKNTLSGCNKKNETLALTDRYNKKLYARSVCRYCYSVIYNGQPLYLTDLTGELGRAGIEKCRLEFSIETPEEAMSVFRMIDEGSRPQGEFTRGHYTRGVE